MGAAKLGLFCEPTSRPTVRQKVLHIVRQIRENRSIEADLQRRLRRSYGFGSMIPTDNFSARLGV
jgi:hypothetical protein